MGPTSPARVVVHAGAGRWDRDPGGALEACVRAASAGRDLLRDGGSAVEAAVAAVRVLEDDPACNAGTGAVATTEGTHELDACVMDGWTLSSGAVGCLTGFRNPILVAERMRREGTLHLLVADGAARYALERGFERHDDVATPMDHVERGETVGAVALDASGALAAATSTGGKSGQPPGRIGDTPITGAGTYADSRGACSCTGEGEAFARACTAFWAVDRLDGDVDAVATAALARTLDPFGGDGGLILLKADGSFSASRTTLAMPWATASLHGEVHSGR